MVLLVRPASTGPGGPPAYRFGLDPFRERRRARQRRQTFDRTSVAEASARSEEGDAAPVFYI